jgi:hypothetical protein
VLRSILLAVFGLALVPSSASSRTWYITPDGTGDASTIQAGIDSAAVGDTVALACGTYFEHGLVLDRDVLLKSTTGQAACVTIDGQSLQRILQCSTLSNAARITGITFTNGFMTGTGTSAMGGAILLTGASPIISGCVFVSNQVEYHGGAVACYDGAAPHLLDCVFQNNSADAGGGVHAWGAEPRLERCVFTTNYAAIAGAGFECWNFSSPLLVDCDFVGNVTPFYGGGFYSEGSSPELQGCSFTGNTAEQGGGLVCRDFSPTITNCSFENNAATGHGGGILFQAAGIIEGCEFIDNTSDDTGGGAVLSDTVLVVDSVFLGNTAGFKGGGAACTDATTITGCVFAGNAETGSGGGTRGGGGVFYVWGTHTLSNSTVAGNSAADRGGGIYLSENSNVAAASIILYGNTAPDGHQLGSYISGPSIDFSCSDVDTSADWHRGAATVLFTSTNFFTDPLFCDLASLDLDLHSDSPCAPENSGGCGLIGALPVGCGPVTVDDESWGRIKGLYWGKSN